MKSSHQAPPHISGGQRCPPDWSCAAPVEDRFCDPRSLLHCSIHSETEDKPSSVALLEKHRNLQGCDNVATHSRQVSLCTEHFETQLFKDTRTYSDPSYSVHQQWNYWSAWNCCGGENKVWIRAVPWTMGSSLCSVNTTPPVCPCFNTTSHPDLPLRSKC